MSYYENRKAINNPPLKCAHNVRKNFSERDVRYCPSCEIETAERRVDNIKASLLDAIKELDRVKELTREHPEPWNGSVWNKPDWLKEK